MVNQDDQYHLGIGDRLRVTVFGQEDLSGEFEVDSTGRISLPPVGDLFVVNRTLDDVEQLIVSALKPDYLQNPVVSVDIIEYRDCFIIGMAANRPVPPPLDRDMIMRPPDGDWGIFHDYPRGGGCHCAPGMSVQTLVSMCGGFTDRTVEDECLAFITRADGGGKQECAGPETLIMPGDVIQFPERERYF